MGFPYGALPRDEGDYAGAAAMFEEALTIFKEERFEWAVAVSLTNLAELARLQCDARRTGALYHECLALYHRLGAKNGVAECLEGLAAAALLDGKLERAARLYGAAERRAVEIGAQSGPQEQALRQREIAALRAAMAASMVDASGAEDAFAQAWAAGATLSLEEAIAEALIESAPA